MKKGIDVSYYQGKIDWNRVKNSGIDFVIIRAGYGKTTAQKDQKFEEYYAGAKAVGLDVGAYWYSYATDVVGASVEADACLQAIKGKIFDFPIYFDLEEKSAFARGKDVCSQMVRTFCSKLELSGYFAGLYMSRYPLSVYISDDVRTRYALWIAEYGQKPLYSGAYGMWQSSSTGVVDGISGYVDTDTAYVDYATIIKNAGLNGYSRTVIEKSDSTYQTYTVVAGDTLTGIAKKFGTTVDKIVADNGIKNKNLIYVGQRLKIG